jgi:hypothetical protein
LSRIAIPPDLKVFNNNVAQGTVRTMDRIRSWKTFAIVAILLPASGAFADPLIPWPWLESSRYSAWKQDRDQAKADWYARRAQDPVGSRRRYFKGKNWPPFPRPEGISMLPGHRYHAAHYWPYPYACQDRQSVREYVAAGEDAGWMSMTTLYDYHFNRDNQSLNRAGLIHMNWILRNAPEHRKVMYVQAAGNQTATQIRLINVQNELVEVLGEGNLLPIVPRVTAPLGRPALEVDAIQRADRDSQPAPRISPALGGGGSGGSGASGGSSGGGGSLPRVIPSSAYNGFNSRTSNNTNFGSTRTR